MFSTRSILLYTIVSCVVIMTNQANVSTSLKVIAPVSKSARRLYLDSRSPRDRRLKIKMPKKICGPAASAGSFIIEQAIECALKVATAGVGTKLTKVAGAATKAAQAGAKASKTVGKKIGGMFDLKKKTHELSVFVMKKLLGALGCPKKRRLGFFKKLAKGIKKTTDKAAKGVKKTADKAAKGVAKEAKKAGKNIAKESKKQMKAVGKATKNMAKAANKLAKDVKKTAKKGAKFAKKYGATILKVACVVVAKTCKPACTVAVKGIVTMAAYFGIPLQCISGVLEKGCQQVCKAICGKRRLMIRRSAKF